MSDNPFISLARRLEEGDGRSYQLGQEAGLRLRPVGEPLTRNPISDLGSCYSISHVRFTGWQVELWFTPGGEASKVTMRPPFNATRPTRCVTSIVPYNVCAAFLAAMCRAAAEAWD